MRSGAGRSACCFTAAQSIRLARNGLPLSAQCLPPRVEMENPPTPVTTDLQNPRPGAAKQLSHRKAVLPILDEADPAVTSSARLRRALPHQDLTNRSSPDFRNKAPPLFLRRPRSPGRQVLRHARFPPTQHEFSGNFPPPVSLPTVPGSERSPNTSNPPDDPPCLRPSTAGPVLRRERVPAPSPFPRNTRCSPNRPPNYRPSAPAFPPFPAAIRPPPSPPGRVA